MSRLKPKTATDDIEKLEGKVKIYTSRLGAYRYVIHFLNKPKTWGMEICCVYSGEIINGKYLGIFTGLHPDDIRGKVMRLSDVPTELIETALEHI